MKCLGLLVIVALCCVCAVQAIDRKAFHTSKDSLWFQRIEKTVHSDPFGWHGRLDEIVVDNGQSLFRMPLYARRKPSESNLVMTVQMLENGVVRVKVTENDKVIKRHGARWSASGFTLVGESVPAATLTVTKGKDYIEGCAKDLFGSTICMHMAPDTAEVKVLMDGVVLAELNKQQLLHVEQRGEVQKGTTSHFNGHTEKQPFGAMATSIDVGFPQHEYVYGLAEHSSTHALKRTRRTTRAIPSALAKHASQLLRQPELMQDRANIKEHPEARITPNKAGQWGVEFYEEPYRLFNTDVFRFEIDEPTSLYGSVPYISTHADAAGSAVGLYYLNAAEAFVHISGEKEVSSEWTFETGDVDVLVLPSVHTQGVRYKYATLTGFSQLPPLWALGKHQCHWNYMTQEDTLSVDRELLQHDIPYDTIWLDIEHTDGKRYFTWDQKTFGQHDKMIDTLDQAGRHLVLIIDPHVKDDASYSVFSDLTNMKGLVRTETKDTFRGKCWPGMSVYADFQQSKVRDYWAEKTKAHLPKSHVHVWNDMNEPSVFEGPEGSSPRHMLHCGDDGKCVENRDVHNVFGMAYHESTYAGLLQRDGQRPFVLTRSFHAGTQRTAFIWTGDNAAGWSHLRTVTPMVLSLGAVGIPFSGSDIGGFFDNCDGEMLARWYQAALLHPFYRNHANIQARRREPYLFPNELPSMRQSTKLRYSLLQHLYTASRTANVTGAPVAYSLADAFPFDSSARVEDNAYLVQGLIVVPVYKLGSTTAYSYAPTVLNQPYPVLRFISGSLLSTNDNTMALHSTLNTPPLGILAGVSVFSNESPKRNAKSTVATALTITVAPLPTSMASADHTVLQLAGLSSLNIQSNHVLAHGKIYRDDYITHRFRDGEHCTTHVIVLKDKMLVTTPSRSNSEYLYLLPASCHATSYATPMCSQETQAAYKTLPHLPTSNFSSANLNLDVPSLSSVRLLWAASDLAAPVAITVHVRTDGHHMTETWCNQIISQNPKITSYPLRNDLFVSKDYSENRALRARLPENVLLSQEICIGFVFK